MDGHAGRHGQLRQQLAGRVIGRADVAVGIQGDQGIRVVAQRQARPVQAQQQLVRALQHQGILDAACRMGGQVTQLGPFGGFNAGEVQHADAAAVRAEQRRTGAAVDRGVVEEVFAAVQPDRVLLVQGGADGRGADAVLRQVDADACDDGGALVAAVDGAIDIDHHAGVVGQDGEVARIGKGPAQLLEDRARRLHQGVVGLGGLPHGLGRDGFEADAVGRPLALAQAALPRAGNPRLHQPAG